MRVNMQQGMLAAVLVAAALSAARAADTAKGDPEAMARVASGVYDMSRNPHAYALWLIFDQEDNRFPSFWVGQNASGKITFRGHTDLFTGEAKVEEKGPFTLKVTNGTRKRGLEDRLPAGEWMQALREKNVEIAIAEIGDVKAKGVKTTDKDSMAEFTGVCKGELRAGGRSVAFVAPVQLTFTEKVAQFSLDMAFTFAPADLGVTGGNGKPITVTLCTVSAQSTAKPTIVTDNVLPDLEL